GGPQLAGGDEQVGVDAVELVPGHLGEAQVDGPDGVVELVEQQVAGDGVGLVEPVEGGGPVPQVDPGGPQALLGLGRQVVDPVVVAVVADEGGEQRAGLESGLPVLVGQGADGGGSVGGSGHGH